MLKLNHDMKNINDQEAAAAAVTAKMEAAYRDAWVAAQAGGMNAGDSHEFALDQASRLAPAVSIPVADPLKEARDILVQALCCVGASGRHSENCEAEKFANRNRHCPPNHPAWKVAPKCSCWVGSAAAWLQQNFEL